MEHKHFVTCEGICRFQKSQGEIGEGTTRNLEEKALPRGGQSRNGFRTHSKALTA